MLELDPNTSHVRLDQRIKVQIHTVVSDVPTRSWVGFEATDNFDLLTMFRTIASIPSCCMASKPFGHDQILSFYGPRLCRFSWLFKLGDLLSVYCLRNYDEAHTLSSAWDGEAL